MAASLASVRTRRSSARSVASCSSSGGCTAGRRNAPARPRSAHRRTSADRPSSRARRTPRRARSIPWPEAWARSSVAPSVARYSSTTAMPRARARLAPDRSPSARRSRAVACQARARRSAVPRVRAPTAWASSARATSGWPRASAIRPTKVRTWSASTSQPWLSSSLAMRWLRRRRSGDGSAEVLHRHHLGLDLHVAGLGRQRRGGHRLPGGPGRLARRLLVGPPGEQGPGQEHPGLHQVEQVAQGLERRHRGRGRLPGLGHQARHHQGLAPVGLQHGHQPARVVQVLVGPLGPVEGGQRVGQVPPPAVGDAGVVGRHGHQHRQVPRHRDALGVGEVGQRQGQVPLPAVDHAPAHEGPGDRALVARLVQPAEGPPVGVQPLVQVAGADRHHPSQQLHRAPHRRRRHRRRQRHLPLGAVGVAHREQRDGQAGPGQSLPVGEAPVHAERHRPAEAGHRLLGLVELVVGEADHAVGGGRHPRVVGGGQQLGGPGQHARGVAVAAFGQVVEGFEDLGRPHSARC